MRLAIFDDWRLGLVGAGGDTIRDVTAAVPDRRDADPHGAGWWLRLCRDLSALRPALAEAARQAHARPLREVRLRAPVLNPGKIIACASNYAAHVAEMRDVVLPRHASAPPSWLLDFDVFLKAPSSISGPADPIVLPALAAGREIHHESELTLVIGRGGRDIGEDAALSHVLGYLIGLDITERGDGDRSRRKSHDTFTPLGPWLTTADEVGDPQSLDIELRVGDAVRQKVSAGDMVTPVARIVSHASALMTLHPGDVIMTGAPPGVGPIVAGDLVSVSISRLGHMSIPVRGAGSPT
ncbi:fumarylacetoacetate hydrolase family protein [Nonomuraea sp. FMUSA5-5]|uniref:Fumarylacetoacetate hydrolase family protein n=1 Tax=Nonomuraea composti TaxID=2720023 RepID=A0ABX1BE75_9ACTN|nr:fumarylacetoacetate hydrolase family protein [Nonomuraea sp. FMUSA5-5]NJP94850.1 fumarylacetoacetate hydrolase family protein [Nonomuraea sp. FMUSA5-5]